ncbi:MAG: flippase-like domain-containing protein [Bacteroidales bacterium]|nr:flippase-like domain-containing protein [Bacteroidales bacterium]
MKKKHINILLFFIGIILIVVMINNLGWSELLFYIKKVGWWIIPIIATRLLMYPLNTCSWRELTFYNKQEKKVSWLRMFRLTISGYAINYITPVMALGGEPYRIVAMKKDIGTKRATSSVLTYAMMHILSHFVFWIIGFVCLFFFFMYSGLELTSFRRSILVFGCIFIVICVVAIIFMIRAYKNGIVVGFFNILKKIPIIKTFVKKKLTEEFNNTIIEIDSQFKELFNEHRASFSRSLFYETLSRIMSVTEIMIIMWAVNGVFCIGMVESIIISTITSLIANLIFIFPMQVGIREGSLSAALACIGFNSKLGVFVGMITRISELAWIIIGMGMIKVKRFGNYGNTDK